MTDASRPAGTGDLDPSELAGRWLNADPEPRCITALSLAAADGRARARILGVDRDDVADWGESAPGALFTDGPRSPRVAGCLLDYDLGFARLHLQVQLKLGVAVVGSFCTLTGASARARGFVREFLGRLPPGARDAGPDPEAGSWPAARDPAALEAAIAPPAADPELVAGRWLNTASPAPRIAELELGATAGDSASLGIRERFGDGIRDWGAERAEVFSCVEEDGVPSVCLWARYERPQSRVELQIRQNKGILAVTCFTRHGADDERFDHVTRELFYRAAAAPGAPS